MKTKEFLKIFQKNLGFIILLPLISGTVTFLIVGQLPDLFSVLFSISIKPQSTQETEEYQYDGYYALLASDLFGETIRGWLGTPEVVREIFDRSGVALPTQNPRRLSKIFKVKKTSAQHIAVELSSDTKEVGQKIVQATNQALTERTNVLNADSKVKFKIEFTDPQIILQDKRQIEKSILAFFAGLFVVIVIVLTVEYFKEEDLKP